jgi:hypothetical protein
MKKTSGKKELNEMKSDMFDDESLFERPRKPTSKIILKLLAILMKLRLKNFAFYLIEKRSHKRVVRASGWIPPHASQFPGRYEPVPSGDVNLWINQGWLILRKKVDGSPIKTDSGMVGMVSSFQK